jgi:hypothetical protein
MLVTVNTDCLNAVSILINNKVELRKYNRLDNKKTKAIRNAYLKVVNTMQVEFRHVKAHAAIKDNRSFVNDWCDNAAKTEIRKQRDGKSFI